ncbi:MAG TPA: N-acetylmuramoyl-L-alanine amidase-like domain-containing protein [Bacteroidota bacterium]|nr:N-acetylmuramoyl-L-alanine amidase-like domain-containing protein [Bacteroidota bacterium]
MNRRRFVQSLTVMAGSSPFLLRKAFAETLQVPTESDETICRSKFQIAVSKGWQKLPMGEVIVRVGETFLGTPYVANVLEVPGPERLVVNMRGLDCVTFYENSLVLARCLKKNKTTFEDYRHELEFIRYRGGKMDGYTSRLHYTSDYFYDNEKRGVFKLVARDLGGIPYVKTLNFMSTHPQQYRQIRESEDVLKKIKELEEEISARRPYYIPKEHVAEISDKLQDGDILGITTDVEGIDTSHTGICIRKNGELHFMHAPLAGKSVQISEKVLSGYLEGNKRQTGIMVARPLEPA